VDRSFLITYASFLMSSGDGAAIREHLDSVRRHRAETQPQGGRGGNQRMQSITQMRYADGKLWISGLSNEEFASKMWSVAYPFSKADAGTSLEIYHDNHQQLETRAPMYAFIPYKLNNQPYIIGAYTCTPLVKFPVSSLTPNSGNKFRGTTIGELGAGSRPIDMILYNKGGKDYLLLANTNRGVMKIPTPTTFEMTMAAASSGPRRRSSDWSDGSADTACIIG
jgi:hypothetical protein